MNNVSAQLADLSMPKEIKSLKRQMNKNDSDKNAEWTKAIDQALPALTQFAGEYERTLIEVSSQTDDLIRSISNVFSQFANGLNEIAEELAQIDWNELRD